MIASSKCPCDKAKNMQWPTRKGHKIRLQCWILTLAYYRTCIFNSINLAVIGKKWLLNFNWIAWFFIFIITLNFVFVGTTIQITTKNKTKIVGREKSIRFTKYKVWLKVSTQVNIQTLRITSTKQNCQPQTRDKIKYKRNNLNRWSLELSIELFVVCTLYAALVIKYCCNFISTCI